MSNLRTTVWTWYSLCMTTNKGPMPRLLISALPGMTRIVQSLLDTLDHDELGDVIDSMAAYEGVNIYTSDVDAEADAVAQANYDKIEQRAVLVILAEVIDAIELTNLVTINVEL